jgi:hypothetical protein
MEDPDMIGAACGALTASAAWVRTPKDAQGYTNGTLVEDAGLLIEWLHGVGPAVEVEWTVLFNPSTPAGRARGGSERTSKDRRPGVGMLLRLSVLGATPSDTEARLIRCATAIEDLLGSAGGVGMGLRRLTPRAVRGSKTAAGSAAARTPKSGRAARSASAPVAAPPQEWSVVPLASKSLGGHPQCDFSALRAAALRITTAGTPVGFRVTLRSDAAGADLRSALEDVDARLRGSRKAPAHPMLRFLRGGSDEDDLCERVAEAQALATRMSVSVAVLAPKGLRTGELLRVQQAACADLERSTRLVQGSEHPRLDCSDPWALHLLTALVGRDMPEPPGASRRRRPPSHAEGDEDIPF